MIETTNNLIFWVGYLAITGVFLSLTIAGFWKAHEELMNTKTYFAFIFNIAFDKRIKKIDEKDFYIWHKELEQKFLKAQKNSSK